MLMMPILALQIIATNGWKSETWSVQLRIFSVAISRKPSSTESLEVASQTQSLGMTMMRKQRRNTNSGKLTAGGIRTIGRYKIVKKLSRRTPLDPHENELNDTVFGMKKCEAVKKNLKKGSVPKPMARTARS
uniref:AlNc14C64G4584 protein n=1 Tax=Albugo laibachii Nc14 TaxID=890382 RepID=F0WD64_9STRA|nr:AlNc14C64G4584 [Albugo laibachii Nc14]|eukprot:CCA19136.1 AlNc14C64G4584 [Albugo laibachii Nc14]